MIAAGSVEAGAGGHGNYGKSHGYPSRTYAPRQAPYRVHGRHQPSGKLHGHRHHQDALRLAAGAVILGTVVTTLDRPRPAGFAIVNHGYAARQPYAVQQNRWYQRDSYGDCFEVRLRRDGQQTWTQTHPTHCR